MSNVIVHQFEETSRYESRLLELPTIIERCGIMNKQTIKCLIEHNDRFDSDAFVQAFPGNDCEWQEHSQSGARLGANDLWPWMFFLTPVELRGLIGIRSQEILVCKSMSNRTRRCTAHHHEVGEPCVDRRIVHCRL